MRYEISAVAAIWDGDGMLISLHSEHLGSIRVATNSGGGVVSSQQFDAWGAVRTGGVGQTTRNVTGQRRDGTGVVFCNAR